MAATIDSTMIESYVQETATDAARNNALNFILIGLYCL